MPIGFGRRFMLPEDSYRPVAPAHFKASAVSFHLPKPGFLLLAPVGILHSLSTSSVPHAWSYPQSSHLEHRVLNLLEALDTALHLLGRRIVTALRVLVDVQLVVFVITALVLALHHILSQDFCDRLHVLDRIVDLFGAGLEGLRDVVGVAREFAGGCECWYVACLGCLVHISIVKTK